MKFCKPRTIEYIGRNSLPTTTNYIGYEDVLAFHGKVFADQWLKFIKEKPTLALEGKQYYYYVDYKHFATTTDMYINSA